jgi:NitT/TauT family transport system ATP-binding protein
MKGKILTIRHLDVTFPEINRDPAEQDGGLQAIADMTFEVFLHEFVCVLGPSGSGKSTLLRVLAGLLDPTNGEVHFNPTKLENERIHPGQYLELADDGYLPTIGYVFQQANLMPWRTVIENITLPLELKGIEIGFAREEANEWIELIGLKGFEHTYPRDLSGGMAQRVALARALIQHPDLLLLDEPFGSLDALTREKMGGELLRLWQNRRTTVIMVTHSISEALLLSDRVLVLTERPGKICLDMKIDLPRPRQEEVRYTLRFIELSRQLRAAIG